MAQPKSRKRVAVTISAVSAVAGIALLLAGANAVAVPLLLVGAVGLVLLTTGGAAGA